MDAAQRSSPLFAQMPEDEIESCLSCCEARVACYGKGELIFHQEDVPQKLFMLLSGAVSICRDTVSGRRTIVTTLQEGGDLFGEVYLFLNRGAYDCYAVAAEESRVLEMPKSFFYQSCAKGCKHHIHLISNMLTILARKAFHLNQRLQLMSCASLRQKIIRFLLQNVSQGGTAQLNMNREEMADYFGVARPSLSRELMNMQRDGLISVHGKTVKIMDEERLENEL